MLLDKKKIKPRRIILVHKPYMERRSFATFKKLLPNIEVIVTSPKISFKDYDLRDRPETEKIHVLVGDMQRLKVYGEKGFLIPQKIPSDVWSAYEKLVKLGYTHQLIKQNFHLPIRTNR